MPDNNDTNAVTPSATNTRSASTMQDGPVPIFESFVYEFVGSDSGLSGEVGGRPGTIGGPIGGQQPKFRVLTYQFLPPVIEDIDHT